MKKRLLILLGVIVFIVLAIQAYKALTKEPVGEQYPPDIEAILRTVAARFEINGSPERTVLVISEIWTLSSTFGSLDLVESDIPVGEWKYRITFNPVSVVKNSEEIIVLIGENSMSINDNIYSTPEEVPFSAVVEIFDGSFNFFSDRYDRLMNTGYPGLQSLECLRSAGASPRLFCLLQNVMQHLSPAVRYPCRREARLCGKNSMGTTSRS